MLAKKQLESDIKTPLESATVPDDLPVNIPEQWLSYDNITLTVDDKTTIIAGEELTDRHIHSRNIRVYLVSSLHLCSDSWNN